MNREYIGDPPARRYVKLLLAFTVGVGVALAPYLGSVGVPGFRALYSLLPVDVRDIALAVSAMISGILALYATTIWGRARPSLLRVWFKRWTWLAISSLVVFCAALLTMVVAVPIEGGEEMVRFTVGPLTRPHRAPCGESVSDSRCIGLITLNPSRVRDMWGDRNVALGQAIILMSYLGVIGAVGALVGVGFGLREGPHQRAPR